MKPLRWIATAGIGVGALVVGGGVADARVVPPRSPGGGGSPATTSAPSSTVTTAPRVRATRSTAPACPKFTAARARADNEVNRRLTTLDRLIGALNATHDSYGVNGARTGALRDAKSGLSALDQQIRTNCYTSQAAIEADINTIFTGYRVYWLRQPQTHIIEAAERLGTARTQLGNVASSLAGLVGNNAQAKIDLDAMNAALTVADAKVGNPPSLAGDVQAVTQLQPAADMTGNVAAMNTARTDLKSARQSLGTARQDALKVVADLGG